MTTAAEKVAGTCYLLEEILIRLPAKSLARSKLVSKQWFSQISNPQFLQLHSRHRPNKLPTGMFLNDRKSIRSANFVSFNDLNPTYQTIPSLGFLYEGIKQLVSDIFFEIELLKSCNGLLLCLVTFHFTPSSPPKYCVCNPTTKKLRLLPPAPFSISSVNDYLAFDPSLSLHYKVICTKSFRESHHPNEMYIYSSENQSWSTYASPFDPSLSLHYKVICTKSLRESHYPNDMYIYSYENQCWSSYACPFDHCREWFYLNGSMYCAERFRRFDVHTEKLEQITMPPRTDNYLWNYLPVMGSHVYCAFRKDRAEAGLQVLEMSSDFSEWIPKYDVNIGPLLCAFPEIKRDPIPVPGLDEVCYYFHAICVVDGVKEDESDLVLRIPGKLILYNINKKTTKELCKLHDVLPAEVRVYQFIECLFDV